MLEKITRWFSNLFADRQLPDTPQLNAADDFVARTAINSPSQATEIGSLAGKITPWEFADFCAAFAKGVSYVNKRFGSSPKTIIITDEDSTSPRYNYETGNIFLPRQFIYYGVTLSAHRQSKTEPYVLNPLESAFVYGVEEAYHCHQMTKQGDYYLKLPRESMPSDKGYTEGYDNHPLEYNAELVVREAIHEFGFDKHIYQMVPGTKPLTWNHISQCTPSHKPTEKSSSRFQDRVTSATPATANQRG